MGYLIPKQLLTLFKKIMFESEPHIYRLIQINDRLIFSSKPAIHRYKILKQIAVAKSGKKTRVTRADNS
jgi:hypothetical protein